MSCTNSIAGELLRQCNVESRVKMGIEQEMILINTEDLLKANISFDGTNPNELIDGITLTTSTTGYLVEGLKHIMNFGNTFEIPSDGENGVIHRINNIRVQDPSVAAQKVVNDLVDGATVFAVVKRKWQGVGQVNKYLFFGVTFGLELVEGTYSSNENDGSISFSLGTPPDFKEPYLPHQLLDTDIATTDTAFGNKFAA